MRVTILPDRRIEEMEPATVAEVLKRLGLHSDAYSRELAPRRPVSG